MCENERLIYKNYLDQKVNLAWQLDIDMRDLDEAISQYASLGCESSTFGDCKKAYTTIVNNYCGPISFNDYGRNLPIGLSNISPNKSMLIKINRLGVLNRLVEESYKQYTNCQGI